MFDEDDLPDDFDEPKARSNGGLLHFIKGVFRVLAVALFYIIPIVCAIVGGVFGSSIRNVLLGVLIGLVAGVVADIVYGGAVATLLVIEETTSKMGENIAELLEYLKRNDAASGGASVAGGVSVVCGAKAVSRADEHGRIDYRTWYDSDGGKHESWIDAGGNKHET